MSISVQPGGAPPVYIVRTDSSSKDAVNKGNPPNGTQRNFCIEFYCYHLNFEGELSN